MGWKRCPRCNQLIHYDNLCVDFVHECNSGKKAVDEEDRIRIDEQPLLLKGLENKRWGTDNAADGVDVEDLTDRGKRESIFKTRRHYEYIKLK